MISEVFVLKDENVSAYPFMFVKKHNKIVFKKMCGNIIDVEGTILRMLSNYSKFSDDIKVCLSHTLQASEELKETISDIHNVQLIESPTQEVIDHINHFYDSENFVELGEFDYNGESFIGVKIKHDRKIIEKLYFNRFGEGYQRFISRVLGHVKEFTDGKIDYPVSFSNKSSIELYKNFKWDKKVNIDKYSHFSFDVDDYIKRNEREIDNRFKSESSNYELKQKYIVDHEDIKKYKHPIVVYPDGSVFPNGKSGIGVVFVENDHVLNYFGKATPSDIEANECESIAIYEALLYAKVNLPFDTDYLEIRTDSLNCIKNIDEKNNVDKTLDIIALLEEIKWLDIRICWNKGHSGIFHNEMADIIAKKVCLDEY